jgi:hypothetical protein
MKYGSTIKRKYNGSENTPLMLTGTNDNFKLQKKSIAYKQAMRMLSPTHKGIKKMNKLSSKYKLQTPVNLTENAYNNRYTFSNAGSRTSKYLVTSFMKNSNVNNKVAADLINTRPLLNLKSRERTVSKGKESFDNNGYLNAIKEQRGPMKMQNQDLNILNRDIASEVDYSDVRSASKSVRQANRK